MDDLDYDNGWRHGTFDKCNGATPDFGRDESDPWVCGYFDAYDSNDVQIENGETELQRLAIEASDAGETFANKTIRPLIDAEIARLGYEGEQREYFWEGIFDQL
jgi:hypothetical protein